MWEKFNEIGFDLVAIGLICANMTTFIVIALYDKAYIWEPMEWILYAEAAGCLILLVWGIERLMKDMIQHLGGKK